ASCLNAGPTWLSTPCAQESLIRWLSLSRPGSSVDARFPRSAVKASRNYPRRFRCETGRWRIPVRTSSSRHMFTGIIEEIGEIIEVRDTGEFRTIRVRGRAIFDDLRPGSSIAVNGV